MKLWRFSDPGDYQYAQASRRGTWEGFPPRRVKPLVIEWEPGSDVIGDFTWPGFDSDIVLTDRVGVAMKDAEVTGFELASVEMVELTERAKRVSRKKRVTLPYAGPKLWDLWVTGQGRVDRERSTITVNQVGADEVYEVAGVERREAVWDQQRMTLVKKQQPRVEGHGLFVRTPTGIFRVPEFPAWVFCTDDVKRLIQDQGFTNVSFLEMGEVLEPSAT